MYNTYIYIYYTCTIVYIHIYIKVNINIYMIKFHWAIVSPRQNAPDAGHITGSATWCREDLGRFWWEITQLKP